VLKVTLANLRANRRRLVSTFLGVLLGIAFLSGTLVLSDTIRRTFDNLFADVNKGVDTWVRSSASIKSQFGDTRARIPDTLTGEVAQVQGVAAAEGQILGFAQLVGSDGKPLGRPDMGAPVFGGNWAKVKDLNPFRLVEGRPPEGDHEVVIDRKSSLDGKLHPGSDTIVLTQAGPIPVHVVGVAKFGQADSPAGASFTLFTLPAAQRYIARPGQVDAVAAVAQAGISQGELAKRVQARMPQGVEAITGTQLTKENQKDIQKNLSIFTTFLSVFAGVALLVTTFSIYNTFSIIVAQRTRQMALLRAIGAGRRQVLGSVLLEAFGLGLVASIVGLFAGVGVAGLLKGVLKGFGVDIPAGGTVLAGSTVVTCLIVGVGVTVVAALSPAVKASRVPPVAVMREVAVERTRPSLARVIAGGLVTLIGALLVLSSLVAKTSGEALQAAGSGAALLILATLVLGPVMAGPLAGLIALPVQALRGVTGRLVRENTMRNPRRTAGSANALLIGVGVVAIFTVFAASIKASVVEQVRTSVGGDLVADPGTRGVGGFNPSFAQRVQALPEVDAATALRFGAVRIANDDKSVTVVDPKTIGRVFDLRVQQGALSDLGSSQVAVSETLATEKHYRLGTKLPARFPDGVDGELTVAAIFGNKDVAGNWVIGLPAWEPHANDNVDNMVLIKLKPGVSLAAGKAAVQSVAKDYPGAKVRDRNEFASSITQQVNQLLGLVYTMLTLAIIIALLGIANTLSLSVFERLRELGLLRAVGMTRGQLRSTIRWEAVIIAVFGAVGGLGLGVFLGWALVRGAGKGGGFSTFQLPVGSLLAVLVISAVAGVLAGLRAAWRASKLDVLQAIGAQ
jgi:putative ABC transport system permease protein